MDLSWKKDVERTLRQLEERTADLPTRIRGGGGSGTGGGTGDDLHYEAPTKAELTDASTVSVKAFGRVDGEGADNGMVCVPNPAKDGWDALNFWE